MGSIDGLRVQRRVPVGVHQNNGIGSLQVEAEASRPGGQDEDWELTVWLVEHRHPDISVFRLGLTVQPQKFDVSEGHEVLENIDQFRHLRK